MNLPGTPSHLLPEGDDQIVADRLLALVDSDVDRTVMITVDDAPDDKLDEQEARMIRVFDLAKEERPNLAVKILPAAYVGENSGVTALAVVVHEHEWVGGGCVRGCGETREAA